MVGVLSRLAGQHRRAFRLDDKTPDGGIALLESRGTPGK